MFHQESWKTIYFGIKRSKVKVTRHKKTVPEWGFCNLVSDGFFRLYIATPLDTIADRGA